MRHEGTFELFSYWNRLRAGRSAPVRHEIEPGDIRKRLPGTFILERRGAADGAFRLAGTDLCTVHGRELKGTSFVDLWRSEDRGLIARVLRSVFNEARVALVAYEGRNDHGRTADFELLLLPLAGHADERRLLGSSFAIERPYWLGAYPITGCKLASIRIIDPNRDPVILKNRPAIEIVTRRNGSSLHAGEARPATGFRRFGHLAVFDGGKRAG